MIEYLEKLEKIAESGQLDMDSEIVCEFCDKFEDPNKSLDDKINFFHQLNEMITTIFSISCSSYASIGSIVNFGVNVIKELRKYYKVDLSLEEYVLISNYENFFNDSIEKLEIEELIKSFKVFLNYSQKFTKSVMSESTLNKLSAKIESSKDKFFWYLKILLDPDLDSYKNKSKLIDHFLHMMLLNYRNMISLTDSNQKIIDIEKIISPQNASNEFCLNPKDFLIKIDYSEPLNRLEKFCYDFNVLLRLNQLKTSIKLKKIEYHLLDKKRFFTIYINYFGKTLFQYIKDIKCRLEEGRALFIIKQILIKTLYLVKKKVFIDSINPFNVFVSDNSINVLPQLYFAKKFEYCQNEDVVFKFTDKEENPDIQVRLVYSIGIVFVYLISGNIDAELNLDLVKGDISIETLKWLYGLIGPGHSLSLQEALNFLDD